MVNAYFAKGIAISDADEYKSQQILCDILFKFQTGLF